MLFNRNPIQCYCSIYVVCRTTQSRKRRMSATWHAIDGKGEYT